jgi:hypothetical protein
MLPFVPASAAGPIIDGSFTVRAEARGEATSGERQQNGAQNGASGTDEPGRWDDVVAAWFSANPQALTGPPQGISDLARAMCRDQEGDTANYEDYKSRAHRLFHEFRESVRIPVGKLDERLGTDISHTEAAQ